MEWFLGFYSGLGFHCEIKPVSLGFHCDVKSVQHRPAAYVMKVMHFGLETGFPGGRTHEQHFVRAGTGVTARLIRAVSPAGGVDRILGRYRFGSDLGSVSLSVVVV